MKQFKYLILVFVLSLFSLNFVNATYINDTKTIINRGITKDLSKEVSRQSFFEFLSDYYLTNLPKSYKYIDLKFKDVKKDTKLYDSLQKLVYIDIIENNTIYIYPTKKIDSLSFYKLAWKVFNQKILEDSDSTLLKDKKADLSDILVLLTIINQINASSNTSNEPEQNTIETQDKFKILEDVYSTIISSHYNKDKLSKDDMIYQAIQWLAAWTWDKFTTYFPPVEKKAFSETLAWEYEWIWSYVDMLNPWELRILAPLSWSPAEKAGLKVNDIITKIDNFELTKDTTLDEAISKIKWAAWTKVTLTIKRWTQILTIEVQREKITLKDVDGKSLDSNTYYMNIRIFGDHLFTDFKAAVDDLKTKTTTTKLIIDLRNNPGWYLDQVSALLSYFVPENSSVAVVKYNNWLEQTYRSAWYKDYDFSKLKIIILQNGWSASASEIMAWTLRDYYPDLKILWEQSYGKWSVQTIKTYYDWSSLKYTIAHWFTGKTETWIDWVGIKPDIELKYDEEQAKKWVDNQLEAAKNLQ